MQEQFKLKEGMQVQDSALDGVRHVTLLHEDNEGAHLAISQEGKSPRTLILGTDYFYGLFERVTTDEN